MTPPRRNAADGAKASNEAVERAKEQRVADMAMLMSTRPGRRYVFQLLESCNVFVLGFSPDPYMNAFKDGERNIGLRILADVNEAAPEQYITMLKESKEEK